MAKDFLIIGDSNVTRNYSRLGYQAQSVAVVPARNLSEVTQALKESVKATYTFVVFACITNLIIAAGEAVAGADSECRLASIMEMLNNILPLLR